MQLLDLPDEVIGLCCDQTDLISAKTVRLACKRLAPLANKRLFSHLHFLPTTESADNVSAVLEDPRLNRLVTTISIEASLSYVDPETKAAWDAPDWLREEMEHYDDDEYGIEINGVLSNEVKAVIHDLGRFGNLRRVELKHDFEAKTDEMDQGGNHRESIEYRAAFLKHVVLALSHPLHPADNLRSLSICNLQDQSFSEIVESRGFKTILSRLRTLELCIATETHEHAPEHEIHIRERHQFFGHDLLTHWLEPVQQNLVHLKLYGNTYWGYLPKCDLRGLHFPQLKSLALGNMTFTHDWQLDWIISHGRTLKSLTLDDCPIIHEALLNQALDSERYCIFDHSHNLSWDGPETHWFYSSRWHSYFRKLHNGLPYLRHFAIGQGPWNGFGGEDSVSPAFEAAALLRAELLRSRYSVFDWGRGPSQWGEPQRSHLYNEKRVAPERLEEQYDVGWVHIEDCPPAPLYPDCWKEDQETLVELLAAVRERNLA